MKNLPPIHNTRSPEQWDIISKYIDFKDKTVLDLGCGYGDILFRCWAAGAKAATGIDNDRDILIRLADFAKENKIPKDDLFLIRFDLNRIDNLRFMFDKDADFFSDIIICFSVLPYLKQPFTVLEWMQSHSKISLIECQLSGDGPGFGMIQTDDHMRDWLTLAGWQSVEAIGHTMVKEGRYKRTIWMCHDANVF